MSIMDDIRRDQMMTARWLARLDKDKLLQQQRDLEQMRESIDRETRVDFAVAMANAFLDSPCTEDRGCLLNGERYADADVAMTLSMAVRTKVLEPAPLSRDKVLARLQECIEAAKDDKAFATLEMLVMLKRDL